MNAPVVLIIGTADTKAPELEFLKQCVGQAGGTARIMDVGVLGDPPFTPDYSKHDVAKAAGTTNAAIIALGDENAAMTKTAHGASALARSLSDTGQIDGVLAIGGTMATDLALDVVAALPMGMAKVIVSTVAFSPLLPPARISPDVIMMLWAGGLYGLNAVCKSTLSQAAGATVGAARMRTAPLGERPIVGMTSLGKTSLKYMVHLRPEIESRGFELAVFHTTGLGGRAVEALAASGKLAVVMDFSLVEVSDHCHGSVVSAGADRLESAGLAGVPQIVAPGGVTLVDLQAWAPVPDKFCEREIHTHNRLISCAAMTPDERVAAARDIARKLMRARGPTVFIMPLRGIDEWDKPGGPFHDPEGLGQFADEMRRSLKDPVKLIEIDAHINDPLFATTVLTVFDDWLATGVVALPEK